MQSLFNSEKNEVPKDMIKLTFDSKRKASRSRVEGTETLGYEFETSFSSVHPEFFVLSPFFLQLILPSSLISYLILPSPCYYFFIFIPFKFSDYFAVVGHRLMGAGKDSC